MKTRAVALLLAGLLCFSSFALCDSGTSLYGFEGRQGAILAAHLQPNGDLLIAASGFMDTDYKSDQSVIRIAPDGEIVWAYHIPYMSEIGGAILFELSDGRYAAGAVDLDNGQHIYFFDAEDGFLHVSDPIKAGWLFPMDGYILGVDGRDENRTRLRWINLEGIEEKHSDFTFHDRVENPYIAKSENGFIMMTTFYNEQDFMLTKVRDDGSIEWQNGYETPLGIVNYLMPDLRGGVFIMSDPGSLGSANNVMRVDKAGNKQWDVLLERGNGYLRGMGVADMGYRIQLAAEDTIRFGIILHDGTVEWEPERSYPSMENAEARYYVDDRILLHTVGTEHVYGNVWKGDQEEGMLFLLPLDRFLKLENPSAAYDVYDKSKMRSEIIAHIPNYEDGINYRYNTVRLTTYYFGSFVAQLPKDASLADLHTYEHVKVVLVRPEKPFNGNFFSHDIEYVNAISIEGVDVMRGTLLEQTDEYMDISIWTYERNSAREGDIQRFFFTEDSVFSRYVPIGEDVNVTYETDEDGNLIAWLVTGFVG